MAIDRQQKLPSFNQLWQRIERIPLPKTEESLLLRVLVQVLVSIGIIATDVAAETQMSLWAVPLSMAGATWSWYRRKKRNVATKFAIALGMLLTLPVFFGNLFANLNDTRLVLAELLVQLQVLHSFDLPRRKDLGYSMVIGLILLGVAGTVSQTLAFAPWLLLFLAVALPVLVLDYRSRLGLESVPPIFWRSPKSNLAAKGQNLFKYSPLNPKRLAIFLAIILAIGLTIFLLMPRFPGYQLQTFPVSSPIDLNDRNFDEQNRGIANPGYVREGQEGSGAAGGGQSPTEGAGKVDPEYYYGFNNKINQNLRGEMVRKIVMRVRSQAPGFWRVLAFDRYTGQGWEISREDKAVNVKRNRWSYQFFLGSTATDARTKKVIQTYSMVSELPNLLPVLTNPQQIYFPTQEIAIDPEGSLRSPVPLIEGLTYTVISEVSYRDRTLLGKASENYPENIKKQYLQIPPEIEEKVRKKTETILAKSEKKIVSAYEKALYLTQALKQQYQIQSELPFFQEDEDLVETFLFRYQGGYPDHFATTLTIMLRSIGIPARLAVGFAPGKFNPFTGYYIVHNTDAHALVEVYFPQYGWFAFDPIPGHEIIPPSFEEDQTFGVLGQFWKWIAGLLPSPVTGFLSNLWNELIRGFFQTLSWLWRFFSGSLFGLFIGSVVLVAVSFLGWLGLARLRNWRFRRRLARLSPMERIYQQMLVILKEKGYPKHPAQTPLEYVRIARQNQQTAAAEITAEISQAYVNWRYGEHLPNIDRLQRQLKLLNRIDRRKKGVR
jgi:transglutaminase-like putative cysteine protease